MTSRPVPLMMVAQPLVAATSKAASNLTAAASRVMPGDTIPACRVATDKKSRAAQELAKGARRPSWESCRATPGANWHILRRWFPSRAPGSGVWRFPSPVPAPPRCRHIWRTQTGMHRPRARATLTCQRWVSPSKDVMPPWRARKRTSSPSWATPFTSRSSHSRRLVAGNGAESAEYREFARVLERVDFAHSELIEISGGPAIEGGETYVVACMRRDLAVEALERDLDVEVKQFDAWDKTAGARDPWRPTRLRGGVWSCVVGLGCRSAQTGANSRADRWSSRGGDSI